MGKATAFLRSCLFDEDYLVRSRSFALAERVKSLSVNTTFLHIIFGEEEREWQLRALSALGKVGEASDIFALKPLLFQGEAPLLMRGALWVFVANNAYVGEKTLTLLGEFLVSPYCRYLKTAFVAEAVAVCVDKTKDGKELWGKMQQENPTLAKAAAFYRDYAAENSLLQVYPYPDYLTKCGQKQGISAKALKRALYFKGLPDEKKNKDGDNKGQYSTDSAGF